MNKELILTSMKFFLNNTRNTESYKNYLVDTFKIKNEGFIFQGITKVEEMYFITAYRKGHNSIIFIYDRDFDLIKRCHLYNNAHVGGISYDGDDTIYITDKHGTVSLYSLNEILNNDYVLPKKEKVDVHEGLINVFGQTACAYLTYYKNKVYLGNFNKKESSILKIYNKNLTKELGLIESFHPLVQGITLNDKYMLVSASFGALNKSIISIYKYDKEFNLELITRIKLPPMLEQIYLDDTNLVCLFEINSYIKKDKYEDILILDLCTILL